MSPLTTKYRCLPVLISRDSGKCHSPQRRALCNDGEDFSPLNNVICYSATMQILIT